MESWICQRDPEIMSGELCFTGTRVPVRSLFGYLRAGHSIEYFLEGFPTVTKEQVDGVLAEAQHHALEPQSA